MPLIQLHPQIISQGGREAFAVLPWEEHVRLKQILEDAQDLHELELAMRENHADEPIPYETARRELELADESLP